MITRLFTYITLACSLSPVIPGFLCAQELSIAAFADKIEREFDSIGSIHATELEQRLVDSKPPVLLDIRSIEEFSVSHLPGAEQISPDIESLPESLKTLSKDTEIVVYCSLGKRSGILGTRLLEEGFTRVKNLRGGIFLWANEGRKLSTSQEKPLVHPFNASWGRYLKKELHPEHYKPVP